MERRPWKSWKNPGKLPRKSHVLEFSVKSHKNPGKSWNFIEFFPEVSKILIQIPIWTLMTISKYSCRYLGKYWNFALHPTCFVGVVAHSIQSVFWCYGFKIRRKWIGGTLKYTISLQFIFNILLFLVWIDYYVLYYHRSKIQKYS